MKVKRYIAKDVQEAMIKVKSELGRDAIILHTRKIKKPGLGGLFKKPLFEVVAAVDSKNKEENKAINSPKQNLTRQRTFSSSEGSNILNSEMTDVNTINNEISSIKSLLTNVLKKIDGEPKSEVASILKKYEDMFEDKNVIKSVSDKILSIVSRQISISDKNDQSIKNAIKIILKDYLGTPFVIDNNSKKQNVIFFVGPTGVGKTTTIAKLAAKQTIMHNKSVALITSDTYRIAAVDQLRTYSEILNVPITVIYEQSELKDAMEKYADKDFIFVDTAGRNHKNGELLAELKTLISTVESPTVFLLLSLTTGYKDMKAIIDSYQFLDYYNLIFTKIDEASSLGNILNAKFLSSMPLSYVTTGQSVPDDIELIDIDNIVNLFVGD
ncbi:flagellar biosynthesis protein FlhF [Wukongibacter baidiensis]|uniref:flagellar biosynthesis protein FlhF n=1 Tax=Wukongibacter baidiensis TaxID=1723361 RepID=UPI003D7F53B7